MEPHAIGLLLAVSSSLFIGGSFVAKKIGLRRLAARGHARAGAGGFRYLREWVWWAGLAAMGAGEALNFVAYAFAPASLVTPLGALSVLVSAAAAERFLGERLSALARLGGALCAVGATVIVVHAPKRDEVDTLAGLARRLHSAPFVAYALLVAVVSFAIAFHYGPKWGDRNVLVHLLLCSAVGSLTVVFCKGVGVSLRERLEGRAADDLARWTPWLLAAAAAFCIAVQMNYLNKALDVFDTSVVTPVYYVLFTTLACVASAILFEEWRYMGAEDVVGGLCGFFDVVVGIVLLNAFRGVDVKFDGRMFAAARPAGDDDDEPESLTDERAIGQGYGSYA